MGAWGRCSWSLVRHGRRASSRGRRTRSAVVYRHSAQRTGPPEAPRTPSASYSTSARAPASPARPGSGRSCRPCWPARWREADAGIDFDGSGWQFLESPGFLLAVVALAAASYGAERSGANKQMVARATAVAAVVLGALLFAGVAGGGRPLRDSRPAGRHGVRGAGAGGGRGPAGASRTAPGRGRGGAPHGLRGPGGAGAGRGGDLPGAGRLPRDRRLRPAPGAGRDQGDRKYAGLRILR